MAEKRGAPRARLGRVAKGLCLVAALGCVAGQAKAAGVEDAPGGTIALGRAANYVSVRDFMATWQNPANLALVLRRDAGLELRLPVLNACFDRFRDPNVDYKPEESFNKVCNESKVFPTGNAGYAMSFDNGLGFGVGVFTPAAIARSRYGDDTLVTFNQGRFDEVYPITETGTESANRYMLLERNVLAAFLMAGVGYQIMPELRVGLSVGAGFATVHYKSVASLTGRTFVDQEVLTDVHVKDMFIPRMTMSVVGSPIPALDLMVQATFNGDIEASGHVDAKANGIQGAPRGDCRSSNPGPHCRVNDVSLRVPYQRVELQFGARYGFNRTGHDHGPKFDPMVDEIGDIELNAYWVNTANVDAYRLNLYDIDARDPARIDFTSDPSGSSSPLPPVAVIPHKWRNTYGFRLGGDYNMLPGLLSLRAGFSYESSAVRTPYMNIDYFATQKIGLHLGASVMLGMVKLSVAYAHLFYPGIDVPVGEGRLPEIVAVPATPPNPVPARAVNEGSYRTRVDIVSLQANVRF